MKTRVHRNGLMFKWITENHEIVAGFKRVKLVKCSSCGRRIPFGNTLCDACFEKDKDVSRK